MRVAIIGGTRFIGPAAVRRLLERGHDVSVLHRGVHPNPVADARDVVCDRDDPASLRAALADGFDAAVDTRAMNEAQAKVTSAALADHVGRAVVLSSQDVYAQIGALLGHAAPPPEAQVTERSPLTVPEPYAHIEGAHDEDERYDKKDVERVYLALSSPVTVLRLPPTLGRGDPRRRFGAMIDRLDAGERTLPRCGGAWRWTHAHVGDVAHAIALSVEDTRPSSHIYNLGEAHTPTTSERVEALAERMGIELRWTEVEQDALPEELAHLGQRPHDVIVSSDAIRNELGFEEVTPPTDALDDHLAGLRESRES